MDICPDCGEPMALCCDGIVRCPDCAPCPACSDEPGPWEDDDLDLEEFDDQAFDEPDESMDGDHQSALESVYGPDDDFYGGGDDW
jgi:hypothetical protein